MSTSEQEYGWTAAEQLYLTLTRVHSPLAAALMTAAVTGYRPEITCRAIEEPALAPVLDFAVSRAGRRRGWS
ncbi:hypothetical protein GFY24_27510 [Nocardia sp. SYP-A9097]|uniref:hypothetical protein n=1 Tax=Nocardia sp. SYP-A9097 TaxID=2663237 RepID=UPI00129A0B6C|nr:hypothetical protein [Nocardia sp. SYP-A9097]MRH91143.1 hypothetical protein [Nocardia sp. SYP-A9097]